MSKRNYVTCLYVKGNHFIRLNDSDKIREYCKLTKMFKNNKKELEQYLELLKEKDEHIKKLEKEVSILKNKY